LNFLPEKKYGVPSHNFVKKNVLCEKGDEITRFDGNRYVKGKFAHPPQPIGIGERYSQLPKHSPLPAAPIYRCGFPWQQNAELTQSSTKRLSLYISSMVEVFRKGKWMAAVLYQNEKL